MGAASLTLADPDGAPASLFASLEVRGSLRIQRAAARITETFLRGIVAGARLGMV